MIYQIPGDADHTRVRELVNLRIWDDRHKGGDYSHLSDTHERWLSQHDAITPPAQSAVRRLQSAMAVR